MKKYKKLHCSWCTFWHFCSFIITTIINSTERRHGCQKTGSLNLFYQSGVFIRSQRDGLSLAGCDFVTHTSINGNGPTAAAADINWLHQRRRRRQRRRQGRSRNTTTIRGRRSDVQSHLETGFRANNVKKKKYIILEIFFLCLKLCFQIWFYFEINSTIMIKRNSKKFKWRSSTNIYVTLTS